MTDPYRQFNDPDEANRVGEDLQTRAVARATRGMVTKLTVEESTRLRTEAMAASGARFWIERTRS